MKPQDARKARRAPEASGHVGFSMTPMIDIVFQLIIFFMLITDLSQTELPKDVQTPLAKQVKEERQAPPDRLIVNVSEKGDLTFRGRKYAPAALRACVKDHADRRRNDASVLIRADRRAPFAYVQQVFQVCGDPGVRIVRVEIHAKQPGTR